MKISATLFFLLLAPAAAFGAEPFEGRVFMESVNSAERPSRAQNIIYRVKGDKNRTEVLGKSVSTFITDLKKEETTVVLEDDMAYRVLPSLASPPNGPQLEETDETATLLGHATRKYFVVSDEGTTELWLAEGFGRFSGFGDGFEKPPSRMLNADNAEPVYPRPWEYALARRPLFPLRVISRDPAGTVILTIEAKAITPQALDDRMFEPSPTYKKVDNWPR